MDLMHTARREVSEETGIGLELVKQAPLVGIDVHAIPAANGQPRHLHHDLTFCFALDTNELLQITDNLHAVWCALDQLHVYRIDSAFQRSLKRALRYHGCIDELREET
jgi:8-oxo-dGTP pyrophosphatase MutT (NUDIX family)